jgi:hypothetical protein
MTAGRRRWRATSNATPYITSFCAAYRIARSKNQAMTGSRVKTIGEKLAPEPRRRVRAQCSRLQHRVERGDGGGVSGAGFVLALIFG